MQASVGVAVKYGQGLTIMCERDCYFGGISNKHPGIISYVCQWNIMIVINKSTYFAFGA